MSIVGAIGSVNTSLINFDLFSELKTKFTECLFNFTALKSILMIQS